MRRIAGVCLLSGALLLLLWGRGPVACPISNAQSSGPWAVPNPARSLQTDTEGPALKVVVEADGVVRLTRTDLMGAGFPIDDLDARHLRLTVGGVEVPMLLIGEDDDTILFYGQAAAGPYTRRNVYWLSSDDTPGARMAEVDGTPDPADPTPRAFPETLHAEEDHFYWQNPPEGGAADHWFWSDKLQAPMSTTVNFRLGQVAPDGQATLRVRLRSRTDDALSPDHHTRVALNGVWLDDALWDGDVPFTHTAVFSPTVLASGINTLTLETVGDTGAAVDTTYLNWLEVDYQRPYTSTDDLLRFTAPSSDTCAFEVSGFRQDEIWLFDVTDPLSPTRVVSSVVSQGVLRFSAPATPETRYLALTPAAWRRPTGLGLDAPSDLRGSVNGADEIIIAPAGFHHALEPLVAHRRSRGLRVALVDVQDVYDEFSHGLFHPPAIRGFLRHARQNWQAPAPRFVLLVGDANMDYLDRFGKGAPNHVPTLLIDTWPVGETPSDNGYVCGPDDPLPEMALGRIPARSADEVARAVGKIIAYESRPTGDWNAHALFVADDDSASFESVSEGLIGLLPPAYRPTRLYADGHTGDLRADIAQAVDSGALLVNYVGHSSVDNWGTWAGGRIWTESDVGGLHNQTLPFVTAATCINGFFAHPLDARSLAEAWVLAQHGAVAAWAPTALGEPSGHRLLFSALYDALFSEGVTRVGEATRQAKRAAYERSPVLGALVDTYVLFGDPATTLRVLERPYLAHLPLVLR